MNDLNQIVCTIHKKKDNYNKEDMFTVLKNSPVVGTRLERDDMASPFKHKQKEHPDEYFLEENPRLDDVVEFEIDDLIKSMVNPTRAEIEQLVKEYHSLWRAKFEHGYYSSNQI